MPRSLRRLVVFVGGLVLILVGLVLVVLPGPLTIPPILLGVWLWSREFEFARRWLRPVQARGAIALRHARAAPLRTAFVTIAGLVVAVALVWATFHYDLVARGRELAGLG